MIKVSIVVFELSVIKEDRERANMDMLDMDL